MYRYIKLSNKKTLRNFMMGNAQKLRVQSKELNLIYWIYEKKINRIIGISYIRDMRFMPSSRPIRFVFNTKPH